MKEHLGSKGKNEIDHPSPFDNLYYCSTFLMCFIEFHEKFLVILFNNPVEIK